MDLGLTEEQELLKNFARDFLEKECTEALVREMEEDEKGYSPALWKGMADQGWCGLIVPPEQGGSGMGFLDLVILTEEFGRALVPGPVPFDTGRRRYPAARLGHRRSEEGAPSEDRFRRRDLDLGND